MFYKNGAIILCDCGTSLVAILDHSNRCYLKGHARDLSFPPAHPGLEDLCSWYPTYLAGVNRWLQLYLTDPLLMFIHQNHSVLTSVYFGYDSAQFYKIFRSHRLDVVRIPHTSLLAYLYIKTT